jgi:hypothetical protein
MQYAVPRQHAQSNALCFGFTGSVRGQRRSLKQRSWRTVFFVVLPCSGMLQAAGKASIYGSVLYGAARAMVWCYAGIPKAKSGA